MTTVATPRGRLRRSSILDATLRVIANEGVRAVTHRRVADEASASIGLITYHFHSTEELIAAALGDYAQRESDRMAELTLRIEDVRGDVAALTEVMVAEVAKRRHELRDDVLAGFALTLEIPRLTVNRQSFEAWEDGQEAAYAALLRAIGREPTRELVSFLEAAIDGLFLYAVVSDEPAIMIDASRVGLRFLLESLAVPSASSGPVKEGNDA